MRWRVLWILGLCLFTQNLIAKEIAGEWILKIDHPRNWESVANSLRGWVKKVRPLGFSKRYALISATSFPIRNFLSRSSHLLELQPNFRYKAFSGADPEIQKSWALSNHGQEISNWGVGVSGMDLNVDGAWKVSTGSQKVKVAILDTGINRAHEDLQNNVSKDEEWGWDFIHQNSNPLDDNGHGSFCAGIIGADWNNQKGTRGINQYVNLLSVKVLDFLGQGSTATAIEGIEYSMLKGAHIINASWGGKQFDPALFETVKKATEKGILFVAASGNASNSNDDLETAVYPASFKIPGVLSVAAYDPNGKRTSFSNFGRTSVHIGAPGLEIFGVELGGYGFRSGTSFAAPHVTGVAALLKSNEPQMNGVMLKERVIRTGRLLHPYEKYFTATGAIVDAENALRGIEPTAPPFPVSWKRIAFRRSTEHPYLADTQERFIVKEPGATHLRVHFKKFNLEKKFDQVKIEDKEGKEVFVYTGELESFNTVEVLGDTLVIQFTSDFNRQNYGFDIDYYEAAFLD